MRFPLSDSQMRKSRSECRPTKLAGIIGAHPLSGAWIVTTSALVHGIYPYDTRTCPSTAPADGSTSPPAILVSSKRYLGGRGGGSVSIGSISFCRCDSGPVWPGRLEDIPGDRGVDIPPPHGTSCSWFSRRPERRPRRPACSLRLAGLRRAADGGAIAGAAFSQAMMPYRSPSPSSRRVASAGSSPRRIAPPAPAAPSIPAKSPDSRVA